VNFADINHCRVLIEIAHQRGERVPEVSYGTGFFRDLVESGTYHLALPPERIPERPERFLPARYGPR